LFFAVFASAVALVLLACVNVSGLMAARGLDRQREIDLRRALGARVEHIAALVLAEAGLLAACGTVLGLALAVPCLRIATGLLPTDLSLMKLPSIDWRVAAFAALATTLCVAGVSVWPIRRGLRGTGIATVSASFRGAARVRSSGRFLVISSQIAIGLALTLGGALLVGSLVRLWQEDIGIDAGDVFAVEVRIPASVAASKPDGAEGILTRVLRGIRLAPGVTVAGATDAPLLRNTMWADDGWKPPAGAKNAGYLNVHGVTSGFFDVVRPRLLSGRLPSDEELDAGQPVIVVSDSVAKAFWPARPAVGETLEYTLGSGNRFLVVGVVADARFTGWDDDRFRQIYAPLTALRRGSGSPSILMRTSASSRVLATMQPLMSAEGADVRAIRAMPLTNMLAETVRRRRFQSWLFGSFAAAALAIVAVGVLGLMAMTAARRTREIGLRMALGATREAVVRLFVREQLAAVAAGVVAGGLISAWAVKFVQTYLYGLTPYDPRVWILAALLVAGAATAGTLIPALRASRIDPAWALRLE
jgi:predicted permease